MPHNIEREHQDQAAQSSYSTDAQDSLKSRNLRRKANTSTKQFPEFWLPSITPEQDAQMSRTFSMARRGATASITPSYRAPSVFNIPLSSEPHGAMPTSAMERERDHISAVEQEWSSMDREITTYTDGEARASTPQQLVERYYPPPLSSVTPSTVPIAYIRPVDRPSSTAPIGYTRSSDSSHTHAPPLSAGRPTTSKTSFTFDDGGFQSSPSPKGWNGPSRSSYGTRYETLHSPQTPEEASRSWQSSRLRARPSSQGMRYEYNADKIPYYAAWPVHMHHEMSEGEYGVDLDDAEWREYDERQMRPREYDFSLRRREEEVARREEELRRREEDTRQEETKQKEDQLRHKEEETKRKEETRRKEDKIRRKEVEARWRQEEADCKELEIRRMEEEVRKKEEEAKRKEDEIQRKEMLAKKKEKEVRRKEAQARKRAEDLGRQEEEMARRLEEEEKRVAIEISRKSLEAKHKEEDVRRKEEHARLKEAVARAKEEEIQRKEEELARREEELLHREPEAVRRSDNKQKVQQDEFRKREEEIKYAEAQSKKWAEDLRRQEEEVARQLEEEQKRIALAEMSRMSMEAKRKEDEVRRKVEETRLKEEAALAKEEIQRKEEELARREDILMRRDEELARREEELDLPEDLTNQLQGRSPYPVASGGFGDIWKCELVKPSETVQVAVKTIRVVESDNEELMQKKAKRVHRELKVWGRLKHHSILPLWGVATDFGPHPAMIGPWAENGALTGFLERQEDTLAPEDKFSLLNDIALGLQYLHSKSVVHGDLTGSNVLIYRNGRACLADFGLSTIILEFIGTSYFTSSIQGNVRWIAAELFDVPEGNEASLGTECDIYSFGSIILQVLTCKVPYYNLKRDIAVMGQVAKGVKPEPPKESQISPRHWEFIQRCWSSPASRPLVGEIVAFVARERQALSS